LGREDDGDIRLLRQRDGFRHIAAVAKAHFGLRSLSPNGGERYGAVIRLSDERRKCTLAPEGKRNRGTTLALHLTGTRAGEHTCIRVPTDNRDTRGSTRERQHIALVAQKN